MARTVRQKLDAKDITILDYIKGYFKAHGYAPTIREIQDGTEIKSLSTIQLHMERLHRLEYLASEAEFGSPRAFRVTNKKVCQ